MTAVTAITGGIQAVTQIVGLASQIIMAKKMREQSNQNAASVIGGLHANIQATQQQTIGFSDSLAASPSSPI